MDAAEALDVPGGGVQIGAMQEGMAGEVFFPHLPEACCAVSFHITPARIIRLRGHGIEQVVAAFETEEAEEEGTAGDADVDMSVADDEDLFFEAVHYRGPLVGCGDFGE